MATKRQLGHTTIHKITFTVSSEELDKIKSYRAIIATPSIADAARELMIDGLDLWESHLQKPAKGGDSEKTFQVTSTWNDSTNSVDHEIRELGSPLGTVKILFGGDTDG